MKWQWKTMMKENSSNVNSNEWRNNVNENSMK